MVSANLLPVARHSGDVRLFRKGESTVIGFARSTAHARRLIMANLSTHSSSLILKHGFSLNVVRVEADDICNGCGEAFFRFSIGKTVKHT